ncbi:hypothetical protein MKEN_00553000 [Mycena kentingensis (nom. inval.)]|nr:hypothetical protein MKEN_00553000 [Mycena kentingensis (nom. inval.)]
MREELGSTRNDGDAHWRLGAQRNLVDSRVALSHTGWIDETWRRGFDSKLRSFIRSTFPDVALRADNEEQILIRRCDCIYIHYTSEDDYRDAVDLLRCNPEFQANTEEWFDVVNVNLDPNELDFARLIYLFRVRLPGDDRREEDVALVRLFRPSQWKPKTVWENCRILEDGRTMLMLPKYFIRGAHFIPAFGCRSEETTFYLNDVVDGDWFIRAGN